MRRFVSLLVLLLLLSSVALAHSGGTDYKGGHMNHSTGKYHYHHGYPAHSHVNGVCPYDDAVKPNSLPVSSQTSIFEKELVPLTLPSILVVFGAGLFVGLSFLWFYSQRMKEKLESLERSNRFQVDFAFQRGKSAAEVEMRKREADVRRREIAVHSAEAQKKTSNDIKINYRY